MEKTYNNQQWSNVPIYFVKLFDSSSHTLSTHEKMTRCIVDKWTTTLVTALSHYLFWTRAEDRETMKAIRFPLSRPRITRRPWFTQYIKTTKRKLQRKQTRPWTLSRSFENTRRVEIAAMEIRARDTYLVEPCGENRCLPLGDRRPTEPVCQQNSSRPTRARRHEPSITAGRYWKNHGTTKNNCIGHRIRRRGVLWECLMGCSRTRSRPTRACSSEWGGGLIAARLGQPARRPLPSQWRRDGGN